jgi:G6PDH family F420-dependent oxidoreductase
MDIGYWISSEEHAPGDLVRFARQAEEAGFPLAFVTDHYHPWVGAQGHAPFVWSILGGIAQATQRLRVGTGVTCPTMRVHPAIVAQAAATVAAMMPGRFFLGVGTGENLNEHILGDAWPSANERQAMLAEAVDVIRQLWGGKLVDHDGAFYRVQNARLYTLPDELPPIVVAAGGDETAKLAGEIGDGLLTVTPKAEVLAAFDGAGGKGKPRYAKLPVCWAKTEAEARQTAHRVWPTDALPGALATELALPSHFEAAAKLITEERVAEVVICGPDPERHLAALRRFAEQGFDCVAVHQVGPNQAGFFDFYQREILPKF